MAADELRYSLFDCYRQFYTAKHATRQLRFLPNHGGPIFEAGAMLGAVMFNRMWASAKIHPMSGGVGRKRIDNASSLLDLRLSTFGFKHADLPRNLDLGAAEEAANKYLNVAPHRDGAIPARAMAGAAV
jgi:hypothetical protein